MATKVKVTNRKFFNEYRNGSSFSSNTSEFTTRLQGNAGEKLKMTVTVDVATIVNEDQSVKITYDSTRSMLTSRLLDWADEGIWNGADLIIEWNGQSGNPTSVTATCEGISNDGAYLILDSTGKTNLDSAGLEDGEVRSDLVIKVSTVYDFARYKFGIIPNERRLNDYKSELDGTPQAYYLQDITGSLQSMTYSSREIGSNTGTVQIKFDSTTSSYIHTYTLEHEFRLPFYQERDKSNLNNDVVPERYKGDKSFKYCSSLEFGGDGDNTTVIYADNGDIGSVGWFNENFNGFTNFYSVSDFAVSNASSTGVLEATETNTVTFTISSSSPIGFGGSEKIILTHVKLATTEDYSNRQTSLDTNFILSQVTQTEGAAAASNGIFSNVTVTLNSGDLDVSAEIDFSADQQALITDTDQYLIFFTIATQNLSTPQKMDRVNQIASVGTYSKDEDVTGLIGTPQLDIFRPSQAYSGTGYTDFNGFDGDIYGMKYTMTTDVSSGALIKDAVLYLVGWSSSTDFFKILPLQRFPIDRIRTCNDGTYTYQVLSYSGTNNLDLPSGHNLKEVFVEATIPGSPSANQSWEFRTGFQIPFRSWVANNNVPDCFTDYTLPNDGRNNVTSNYDDGTYDIRLMLEMTIQNDTGEDTIYRVRSDAGTIRSRNTTLSGFTYVITYEDESGKGLDEISSYQNTQIIITISHSSGTLATSALEGQIWLAVQDSEEAANYLSTVEDFTSRDNPLIPSDTQSTGNTQFVEIVSTLNQVVLYCKTDYTKLDKDKTYSVYPDLIPR